MSLLAVIDFAAKKHAGQFRKDGKTPYINHPIGVALILEKAGIIDPIILKAAILHDTIEDTNTTEQELLQHFGQQVTGLVMSVTDDMTKSSDDRKQAQIEKMKTSSFETRCIKMADRIYNLRDMALWNTDKQHRYKEWGRKLLEVCKGTHEQLERQLHEACQ